MLSPSLVALNTVCMPTTPTLNLQVRPLPQTEAQLPISSLQNLCTKDFAAPLITCPSGASHPKPWTPLCLPFHLTPCPRPAHLEILSTPPSKCAQNLMASDHRHCPRTWPEPEMSLEPLCLAPTASPPPPRESITSINSKYCLPQLDGQPPKCRDLCLHHRLTPGDPNLGHQTLSEYLLNG